MDFFRRRKAMKGRLYFATKSQKEGKIMIKTHPCAQIFCCDMCGFEKVISISVMVFSLRVLQHICAALTRSDHWMALQSISGNNTVNLGISLPLKETLSNV